MKTFMNYSAQHVSLPGILFTIHKRFINMMANILVDENETQFMDLYP